MKQAETAIDAYRSLEASLSARQTLVRQLLRNFRDAYETWPTGLELLRYATATMPGRVFDVNSIRPRLCELEAQGFVAKGPKRACALSGKRVSTWLVTQPVPPRYHDLDRARQVELF